MCHLIQIGHEIVEASQAAGPKTHQSQMFFEVAFEPIFSSPCICLEGGEAPKRGDRHSPYYANMRLEFIN